MDQLELNALWRHTYPNTEGHNPPENAFLAYEDKVFRYHRRPDTAGDPSYGPQEWVQFCELVGHDIGSHGLEFELAPNVMLMNTPPRIMEILLQAYPDRPAEVIQLFYRVVEASGWRGPVHTEPKPQPGQVKVVQRAIDYCGSEPQNRMVETETYTLDDVRSVYNQVLEDHDARFISFVTKEGTLVKLDCKGKTIKVTAPKRWDPSDKKPPGILTS